MYKIDWGYLLANGADNNFNKKLRKLLGDSEIKSAEFDGDGDVVYLTMKDGKIVANNGSSPEIMELSDYYHDGDALLIDKEVGCLVEIESKKFIYTHQQKLEVLFIGEMCYFVKDEMGNEFALERDSSEIVEEDDLSNKFEIDMGEFRKEDFLKALDIIKKGVISLK